MGKIKKLVGAYALKVKKVCLLSYYKLFKRVKVMAPGKTVEYIKACRCNVSRFGDGELSLILDKNFSLGFQGANEALSKRLTETLCIKNPKVLTCLPRYIVSRKGIKYEPKHFWIWWTYSNYGKLYKLLKEDKRGYVFGDTNFTRPYMDFKFTDEKKRFAKIFGDIKGLFEKEEVLIAEGEKTRLGVGNDFFDGAKSIKRILCPARNAFNRIEEIKKAIIDNYGGGLVLLALGPTASILAAELAESNIWAIDIGHVDVEYEWFLMGAKEKIAIKNKYVNEVKGGDKVEETIDEKYESQIILRIGE